MHVRKELSKISTVKDVRIGAAVVEFDESTVTPADLSAAVQTAGYTVTATA
jgi:copper chaperone CopZ